MVPTGSIKWHQVASGAALLPVDFKRPIPVAERPKRFRPQSEFSDSEEDRQLESQSERSLSECRQSEIESQFNVDLVKLMLNEQAGQHRGMIGLIKLITDGLRALFDLIYNNMKRHYQPLIS